MKAMFLIVACARWGQKVTIDVRLVLRSQNLSLFLINATNGTGVARWQLSLSEDRDELDMASSG